MNNIGFQVAKISQRKEARKLMRKKAVVTIPYAVFNLEEFEERCRSPRVKDKSGYAKALASFRRYFIRLKNGFVVFRENYLKPIIDNIDNIDNIEKVRKIVKRISLELSGED